MLQSGLKLKKNEKRKVNSLIWTDDEVEHLLKVTMEIQTVEDHGEISNVGWESRETKNGDILNLFIEQYPSSN